MNKFAILTKLNLGEYFGMPKDERLKKRKIGTMIGLAACFLPLVALICVGVYFFAGQIAMVGGLAGLIGSVMMVAQVMVIFFGTASYITVMYFSKDNEFLAGLPVSSMSVYLSKLLIVYLSNLIISVAVVLPATIVSGISASVAGYAIGAHFYILSIFSSLLVPVLPLLLVAIISVPMAYVARLFKRSSIATTIISITLFIGVYVGYMVAIFSISGNMAQSDISQMLPNVAILFNTMSKIVYPNFLIASAMTSNGLDAFLNCLYYILIMGLVVAVVLVLTKLTYKKCSTKFMEISYTGKVSKRVVKKRSQVKALMVRDIKSILREPGLALNCLIGVIMAPLMAVIMGVFSMGNMDTSASTMNAAMKPSMMLMMSMMLLIGTNYLANIAVSREGEKFYMVKYMPICIDDYIKAKTWLADCYTLIGAVLVAIGMIASSINVLGAILGAANIVALGYAVAAISIKKDLKKPNLNWLNSRSLLKSRANILVMMLISLVESIALMIFMVLMAGVIANQYLLFTVVYGLGLVVNVVLAIVFRRDLRSNAVTLFNKIEANNG